MWTWVQQGRIRQLGSRIIILAERLYSSVRRGCLEWIRPNVKDVDCNSGRAVD